MSGKRLHPWMTSAALGGAAMIALAGPASAQDQKCEKMLPINIGIAVVPPNVVHTTPHVAKALGLFEKYCVDATLMHFEGGQSATATTAVAQGTAVGSINEVAIGNGMRAKQFWALAPRMPQAYFVVEEIKTPQDLKGKRLSAAGGGVGGFNWRMAREILDENGMSVDDVQFISQGTAGRLPGLLTGQLDGVALHPEDVFIAQEKKPGSHVLVQLADMMPDYVFNVYGASDGFIAENRETLVNASAAMMEASRLMYTDRDRVLPIIIEATEKPPEAVEYAWKYLTDNCVWTVNTGLDKARAEWSIENSVRNGDVEEAKKPTFEQLADLSISTDALAKVGGPIEIGACKL
jgi:NitT/TauT family transport system substrate-binding protein